MSPIAQSRSAGPHPLVGLHAPARPGRGRPCRGRCRRGWAAGRPPPAACRPRTVLVAEVDGEPAVGVASPARPSTPVSTWMPSRAKASRAARAASGSSGPSSRSATSTMVTSHPEPGERPARARSRSAPPPSTISDAGSSVSSHGVAVGPVRRVREAVDRRHRRGGAGVEHDAACRRRTSCRRPPTRPGPASRPWPRTNRRAAVDRAARRRPRRPSRRWPRRGSASATGAQSGCTSAAPATSRTRPRLGERRRRPRIIIFDGTQP